MDAMKPLPFPVRIAAGLVATAVEQARDLPRLVVEFPVTAVSQALQASMRVQQKVTELAIKGDRVLGGLRPVEEKPSWATFDEDEPPTRNGASTVTELRPVARPTSAPFDEPPVDSPEADAVLDDLPPLLPSAEDVPADTLTDELAAEEVVAEVTAESVDPEEGPVLVGYAEMSIPQLRGKLRFLSLDDLRALLAWEMAHGERPPFVTMLTNRITAVQEA
jgi:hypothetical protein